jgi:alkylation response protein AidB-like acyl-CoA dehydrogenase
MSAGMFVMRDGMPATVAAGGPEVRVCLIPKDRVTMKGNWDVMGLRGTGSYDYEVPAQTVDRDFTVERTTIEPLRGGPLLKMGIPGLACAQHAAFALGVTYRALEEVAEISFGKKRVGYSRAVAEHPVFQRDFSVQEANFWGARKHLYDLFIEIEAALFRGEQLTALHRSSIRQVTTWVHGVAMEVVTFCYTWAGSAAFRRGSALGRCMSDLLVGNNHIFVDQITLVDAAPQLLNAWRPARAASAQG